MQQFPVEDMRMGGAAPADMAQVLSAGMPPADAGPIGAEQIKEAEGLLKKYKDGKAVLENRIVENERWYKLRHWEAIGRSQNKGDPEPASAWLLNSIANKHADAMDNFPTPTVLPREQMDIQDADILTSVLPTVLEQAGYEQTYSDMWWYKLKTGTGVTGVFWDPEKMNGLGDIDIRKLDILNLFWEPGIRDLQKSPNLFHVELADEKQLRQKYPQLADKIGGAGLDVKQYQHDESIDVSGKVAVVDWYYKVQTGGRTVLHYCKFCAGALLFASENQPEYAERGYYDHAQYPVVLDTLFPTEDSPVGFGYIDVCKSPQMYIDKLDQVILKHAVMGARPRFFVRGEGKVNEAEFADWQKDFVHYSGSGNPAEDILPIQMGPLHGQYLSVKQLKIDELKETSGNRDFSQGGTSSGVTAASAIAALQEAGSKLSRDMIKSSYRAFTQVCYLCIENMRQFYTEPRMFRIVGKQGEMKFVAFNNARIAEEPTGDAFLDGTRVPFFDIRVVAQKASPFSTVAQNERARELYGMGFFRPDLCDQALAALQMMQFEGIEGVRERISENGTLHKLIQQLAPLILLMAQELDAKTGSQYTPQVIQLLGQHMPEGAAAQVAQTAPMGGTAAPMGGARETQINSLGEARKVTAGEARKRAAAGSMPKV